MKIFKSVILIAVTIMAFLSCQKELSFDNGGVSAGTLKKGTGGDCLPVVVTGVFKKDSVLTNTNFVDVQVNVSTPGTFDIRTDTVNGYAFSKAGSVVTGINTIRLYAIGKPLTAGTNTFTIKYGSSTCTFNITVVGITVQAVFTLGGSPGGCTGATVGGTYTVGKALTPSNTLTVQVNVTTLGSYALAGASTGGFIFSGTGIFTTTGLQNVTLTGNGTPLTAGTAIVTITNIASTCTFNITVLSAGGSPAVFTLDGAPNTCTNFLVAGTYTVGSATSVSNTVKLNVTVQTAGTYSITTNTVNGISFSGTGILAAGPQQVILTATGTPVATGIFNTFKPNVTGSCNFSVTCVAAVPPPNGDYFPLTNNSWWSYNISGQTDTIYNVVFGTKPYNSTTYTEVQENFGGVPSDTTHFRKSGNDYYQWSPTDYYSAFFAFDNTQYRDILFLKENAAAGTLFTPQIFTGTYQGFPATLEYNFKTESPNTSITINSVNYTNVIYVSVAVKLTITGLLATSVIENDDYYYAKGIGLIKVKYTPTPIITGASVIDINIRNYKVF